MSRIPTAGRLIIAPLFILGLVVSASAQNPRSMYDQDKVAELMYANRSDLESLPRVTYSNYVLDHESDNSVLARMVFYQQVGDGDQQLAKERLKIVEFLNGLFVSDLSVGDTVIMPSELELDWRAYSPFPRYWPGATEFEKIVVVDKGVQAWAAYSEGALERWGLVATGAEGTETPTGRYNFNWKHPHRISSLSPPGEEWHMRNLFNFHLTRGLHIHHYWALPTSGPASHGCIRMMKADSEWLYDWADGWVTTAGTADDGLGSIGGRVLEQGTIFIIQGQEPYKQGFTGVKRFRQTANGPELIRVVLPESPYDVPPGSDQQRRFDRIRAQQASQAASATG